MKYDLEHLTQDPAQDLFGPIQDDEALFLYGMIRTCRISRIVEVGGLNGYSATNFLKAMSWTEDSILYSIDLSEVPQIASNHRTIQKNAKDIEREDFDQVPLGLLFLDCHDLEAEIQVFEKLLEWNLITEKTYLILHDTNLYPARLLEHCNQVSGGWVHQQCERMMVNFLHDRDYNCVGLTTSKMDHNPDFPFRHGLTICKKFSRLVV
ncbi:MAG: hypothetical protein ABIS50_03605 [Luteolibacter sp.]|uniref:hypothetical protein n=1 Tax=Luteolibacter sp. TaxID=1962973 RepID=UPI00326514F7